MTTWHPDTCACVIKYDGVDDVTGDLINPVAIKTCRKHADLLGPALASRLLDHNRGKNQLTAQLIDAGADSKVLQVSYDTADNFVVIGVEKAVVDAVIADPNTKAVGIVTTTNDAIIVSKE